MVKTDKDKKANQVSNAAANTEVTEPTSKEASLSPPPINFTKASENDPDKKEGEKDKNNGKNQTDDNFDINFDLLPPELQIELFQMGISADKNGVSISHQAKSLSTKFDLDYDGAASLNLDHGDLNHTMGYNMKSSNLSYGGEYKDFNWGSNYNLKDDSFGLSVGYGASLRPSQEDVSNTFNAAAEGLNSLGSLSSAIDDPLKYAEDNKGNVKAVTKAISMAKKIRKMENKPEFGAGLRLGYKKETGLSIFLGAQLRF